MFRRLEQQQDKNSPNYEAWLTPGSFFGTIYIVEFSGNAGQGSG